MPGRNVLGVSLLLFLVIADLGFPVGLPWQAVRLPLLAATLLSSLAIVARRTSILTAVARPPVAFFAAFALLAGVAAVTAAKPGLALKYSSGYLGVAVVAVTAAAVFPARLLVRGLLGTLLAKLAVSGAVAGFAFAWWSPGPRFQGALGSPNPMGAASGLAFLLLMVHGWYDWRTRLARAGVLAAGAAAVATLAATQSASAAVATVATLVLVGPIGGPRRDHWRGRARWAAVAVALLLLLAVPLLMPSARQGSGPGHVFGAAPARQAPAAVALGLRVRWWGMLAPAVLERPWLGYGAGSTPSLTFVREPPWGTSAHNLYLEAAIYAGIPAATAMLLFVATGVLLSVRATLRTADPAAAGLAAAIVFYAVLSLVEPVILNGAPSTVVVPLVAAAAACRGAAASREGR